MRERARTRERGGKGGREGGGRVRRRGTFTCRPASIAGRCTDTLSVPARTSKYFRIDEVVHGGDACMDSCDAARLIAPCTQQLVSPLRHACVLDLSRTCRHASRQAGKRASERAKQASKAKQAKQSKAKQAWQDPSVLPLLVCSHQVIHLTA